MTNIMNAHTCSIGGVNLIGAMVGLMCGELVQLMGDVMRSA
jgi:hypothetical protein